MKRYVVLLAVLLLVSCERPTSLPSGEHQPENKVTFERKRQCAEPGQKYFERTTEEVRSQASKGNEPFVSQGRYFAYNADRDSCLVARETTKVTAQGQTLAGGYVEDVLTGESLASYGSSQRRVSRSATFPVRRRISTRQSGSS
jgi:hypothetical protein